MAVGAAIGAGTAVLQMWDAKNAADAEKRQANYEANRREFNSKLADLKADEVAQQGEDEAAKRTQDISRMIGSQKANLAAQGVDIESDIALQIKEDTEKIGREDVMAIKNNAFKEAWGLKMSAVTGRTQATLGRIGGRVRAGQTLSTGGAQALQTGFSSFQSFKGS